MGVLEVSVAVQLEGGPEGQHHDSVDHQGSGCQLPVPTEGRQRMHLHNSWAQLPLADTLPIAPSP